MLTVGDTSQCSLNKENQTLKHLVRIVLFIHTQATAKLNLFSTEWCVVLLVLLYTSSLNVIGMH